MIKTENIKFAYKKNVIFEDMSFDAKEGEITYLAGVNGAGKTTWIKCATELLKLKRGSITFDGYEFDKIKNNFAVCFDTPPLYGHLSCRDNLTVLYNVDSNTEEAERLFKSIGFSEYLLKSTANKLSYGQRHRLGIIGALLRNPKYLILDEPDMGLDPIAWEVVKNEICKLKDRGSTVILTGQNFVQLEEVTDHILMISEGMIIADMSVCDFMDKYCNEKRTLKEAFIKATGGAMCDQRCAN